MLDLRYIVRSAVLATMTVFTALSVESAVGRTDSCSTPYADATVTEFEQPDYPEGARDLGIGNVTVLVQVSVSASGKATSAIILKSSRNSEIDREALRVAKLSKYSPKMIDCHPVEGTYMLVVDFVAD